jgi:hypothetical protein
MGLIQKFGELFGFSLSDRKASSKDVCPPIRNTELYGGCDLEGAYESQLNHYNLKDPDVQKLISLAFSLALLEEEIGLSISPEDLLDFMDNNDEENA